MVTMKMSIARSKVIRISMTLFFVISEAARFEMPDMKNR
jgi:hypothetical protein